MIHLGIETHVLVQLTTKKGGGHMVDVWGAVSSFNVGCSVDGGVFL